MGFFKWFTSKAKMKRWMLLILVGVVLVGYGISNLLYFNTLGLTEIRISINSCIICNRLYCYSYRFCVYAKKNIRTFNRRKRH